MDYTFTKASKEQAKLRLAIFGPSGAGKTFTALRLATGIGGEIAVIDTERGSASKYADRFAFDVLELPAGHRDIAAYCAAIKAAQKNGYSVLIIDSLTHGWHELLDEVDKLARSKYSGNRWSAWSEGTPKQRTLVDAILDFNGHVIATMRSKTEWTTETTDRGKTKPVRIGLTPEQGKGIEYEFDMLMEMNQEHDANVIKDRTGRFQDAVIDKPGEDLGKALAKWLKEGKAPEPEQETETKLDNNDKLRQRWDELLAEAAELNIEVKPLPDDADKKEIIRRGKELASKIEAAKKMADAKDERQWTVQQIKALIEAGLADNVHNATAMLNRSNLTPADEVDVCVAWAKQYRASRDAGGSVEEAATVANTWWASEQAKMEGGK